MTMHRRIISIYIYMIAEIPLSNILPFRSFTDIIPSKEMIYVKFRQSKKT
jgi:hypothetical protein